MHRPVPAEAAPPRAPAARMAARLAPVEAAGTEVSREAAVAEAAAVEAQRARAVPVVSRAAAALAGPDRAAARRGGSGGTGSGGSAARAAARVAPDRAAAPVAARAAARVAPARAAPAVAAAREVARLVVAQVRSRSSSAFLPPPPLASRRASTWAIDWTLRTKGTGEGTIQAEDFPFIARRGFDHVRIPIRFSGHASAASPYTIDAAFFSRVDTVLNQAAAANLAVVVDMHHYDELPQTSPRIAIASWRSGHRLPPATRVGRTRSRSSCSTNPTASSTPPGMTSCSPRYGRSARPTRGVC